MGSCAAVDGGSRGRRQRLAGDHRGWREGLRTVLDHSEGDGCCRSLVALPQVGRGCAGSGDRRNLTKGGAWPAAWCISCGRCLRGEELWSGVVMVEHGLGEGRPGAGAGLRCKEAPMGCWVFGIGMHI